MDVKQTVDIFHHNQVTTIPANNHNPMGARGPVDLPPGGGLPLDLPKGVHDGIPEVQHPLELAPGLHPVRDAGIPYQSEGSQGTGGEVNRNWAKSDAGTQPITVPDVPADNPIAAASTGQGQTENHMTPADRTSADGK